MVYLGRHFNVGSLNDIKITNNFFLCALCLLKCVDALMSPGISCGKIFLLYGLSCMILAHIDFTF